MADQTAPHDQPAQSAENIAASGDNVRERIRETVTRAMQERKLTIDDLTKLGGRVLDGAIAGVRDLPPMDKESTLRQVVDGLADAFERTANATRYAFQESSQQTRSYTREEVDRTINDLRTLQEQFVETLTGATSRASRIVGEQSESLNRHIRRTAESIQPSVESAVRAAAEHPVKLAGETASATLRAAPRAAGALLSTIGNLLQSAGDSLAGKREDSPAAPPPADKQ
jgi:hypothetical protein